MLDNASSRSCRRGRSPCKKVICMSLVCQFTKLGHILSTLIVPILTVVPQVRRNGLWTTLRRAFLTGWQVDTNDARQQQPQQQPPYSVNRHVWLASLLMRHMHERLSSALLLYWQRLPCHSPGRLHLAALEKCRRLPALEACAGSRGLRRLPWRCTSFPWKSL